MAPPSKVHQDSKKKKLEELARKESEKALKGVYGS